MQQQSFFEVFPELVKSEFRCIEVVDSRNSIIPEDKYHFDEYFCTKKGCDCGNVSIKVKNNDRSKVFATISYGWEKPSFYEHWGDLGPELVKLMASATLCNIGDQSKLSGYFLSEFKKMIADDVNYKNRIKQHYIMFKQKVCGDSVGRNLTLVYSEKRAGRNERCPCGSGKKYKKCCLHKA
jgi:hypothetical protein